MERKPYDSFGNGKLDAEPDLNLGSPPPTINGSGSYREDSDKTYSWAAKLGMDIPTLEGGTSDSL